MSTVTAASYSLVSQPAAVGSWSPAVALRRSSYVVGGNKHRSPSVRCEALAKPAVNIPPFALVHPVSPADGGEEHWNIKEENDNVKLSIEIPGHSKDELEVVIEEDVLVVRQAGGGVIHARLLMTRAYNKETVKADMKEGVLHITVSKKASRMRKTIPIDIK